MVNINMSTFYSSIIGIIFCIVSIQSKIEVRFEIPYQLQQNFPYSLLIQNSDSSVKFPDENYVLAFELIDLKSLIKTGAAALTPGEVFTGDSFRGFSIENFKIESNQISMKVTFRREAADNDFVVRYGAEKTDYEKTNFFDSKTKGIVYSGTIKLSIPFTITMEAKPDFGVIHKEDIGDFAFNLIPDKYGLITCKAVDGLPKMSPKFVNGEILKEPVFKLIGVEIISLQWMVLLEDHGKNIKCIAGDNVQNITLNVYHYVSKVHTSPPINDKVSRNSQLKCISEGGYPRPKTSWVFISGPTEPHKFFQFRNDNVTLFINSSAPINSNWSFECRGSNDMPQIVQKYFPNPPPSYPIKSLYNFTVIDTNGNIQSSKVGLWIMFIIIFTILIALIVLSIKYRSKIGSFLSRYYTHLYLRGRSLYFRLQYILRSRRTFKPVKEVEKPSMNTTAPLYKYSEVKKNETQRNGAEDTAYTEIVGFVQSKNSRDQSFGPIDRV